MPAQMTSQPPGLVFEEAPGDNLPVFGVSELSQLVKRTIEGRFEHDPQVPVSALKREQVVCQALCLGLR